ncbi:MAG: divalent metal cation transporter [Candidatus Dormibacteraeota bacterium]|nr:divalent metal cation transporter [Candidatus Dormibacteraeota bacterium]
MGSASPEAAGAVGIEGSALKRARGPRQRQSLRHALGVLGPGLITGAADDDPSAIATYSATGAQYGYGQLWTALWMLPLLTAVSEAAGRIGFATGQGLGAVMRQRYSVPVARGVITLLVAANVITIGADIGAVASAVQLVVPVPAPLLTVTFTAVVLALEIGLSYKRYAGVLKWFSLALLAYPISVLLVAEPWPAILRATFVPNIQLSPAFFYILTAVIGTTVSPYMFFWQSSQEAEEDRADGGRRSLRDLRLDNAAGMFASQAAAWFIIVLAGTVLHGGGITNINSAAQAAGALQPLVHTFPHAGEIAKGLFALGILGLGLLAVPVLAGSSSYAVSEEHGWKAGLDLKPKQGRRFYAVIIAAMLVGLTLTLIGVNPIAALVFASVFSGFAAVPVIWVIGRISADRRVMGAARGGWLSQVLIWATFAGTAAAALLIIVSLVHH